MLDFLSEPTYRQIFEKSANSVIIKADPPRFTMMAVSDQYERITSIKRENLVGKGVFEVFPDNETNPSGALSTYQAFMEVIQTKQQVDLPTYKYDIPDPANGQLKPYYWSNSNVPILSEQGEVAYILNSTTDITEQVLLKQEGEAAAQLLSAQQQRVQQLFEQAPVAIATLIGPEHVVEVANEKMLEIWGKLASQIMGNPIFKGLPEAKGQGLEELLNWVYITGERFVANERPLYLPRDSRIEKIYSNFVYEPFRGSDGRIIGIIVLATDVTENVIIRQKIEESEADLQKINQRLELALEAGRFGSYELELATGLMECTPQCKNNYGQPLDVAFNFVDLLRVIVPEDRNRVQEEVAEAIEKHSTYNTEYRINWPDGSFHWVRAFGRATYDEQETPVTMVGVTQRITEQKLAEVKIRESEGRFRSMVEQSPVAMAVLRGKDLIIESVNQALLDIWDKPASVIGLPHAEALPEITSQVFMELMLNVFETGEALYGFEAPANLYKNDVPRVGYFNYVYVPAREPDGSISGILVVTSEVTEQVLAKMKIEASEKRFRTLLEAIPHITWTSTRNGKIDFYNQRWYDYTGLSFEETEGWQWQSAVHPDDVATSVYVFSTALKTGEMVRLENRYRRADGEYRWHLNRAVPLHNEQGEIISWVGTATDIHEQKQLEAELDRQVQQRTEQLQASNQDLRRSNDNLQQFAYVASHDLQEPLRKVQAFGDILKSQYATQLGEGISHLERMQTAASRMSVLIKDLLAFSRISTRQEATDSVSINRVVRTALDDLEMSIQQMGAIVNVAELPTVMGDESQLGQLFQNLLSNALKFRRQDVAPVIAITTRRIAFDDLPDSVKPARKRKMYYQISVSDNGIGFDSKYVDRIFDVFQRLHGKSQYAGTGIGLAIVQKVAINHGGAITARSEPGQGTTFELYLPV